MKASKTWLRIPELIGAAFLLAGLPSIVGAAAAPAAGSGNFDKRIVSASVADPSAAQSAAVDRLRSMLPDVRMDFDEVSGAPAWVASSRGFLSGSGGTGRALSTEALSLFAFNDPDRITKAFLTEHRNVFGHGAEALASALVQRQFVAPHNGLRTVVWQQQVDGIQVFEALLVSHTTRNGELVSISSHFLADATAAADAGTPNRPQLEARPPVSAQEAVAFAAQNIGDTITAESVTPIDGPSNTPNRRQTFSAAPLKGKADAHLVWLPMNRSTLRLCWEVLVMSRARGQMFEVLIDARTGEALVRHGLTENLSNASYEVFLADSPTPMSPGFGTVTTNQPATIARVLVVTNAYDTNASPNGWINDGDNQTTGNNATAFLDGDGDGLPDAPPPQGSPFRVFQPPLDLTQDPVNYGAAAVVNLFFWNNWMHDKLYELGFTEAAGNFQSNNFSRGGLGGDPVYAEAQVSGLGADNNASFTTPPDGSPGIMAMYLWTGPTPHRDGDFDTQVILHEYTHGLSNRRVGGGVGITALQSRGLGEGWSDFYSLALLSKAANDVNGTYPEGPYVAYQWMGLAANYYFGIRRHPYSTDMTKSPMTFKDIDPAQADPHLGVPMNPAISNSPTLSLGSEIHNQGEVWCAILWDARANLINKYGFAVGNQLILQLLTDGMNLTPANPTFVQARDAIIQADLVDTGGANYHQLWLAFAKRGLGYGAVAPASSTTSGVVESYLMPDDLLVAPQTGFVASGAITGPFTPATLTFAVVNTGSNAMPWAAGGAPGWITVFGAQGTLPAGSSTNVWLSINASANTLAVGAYSGTITFTNLSSGVTQQRSVHLNISPPPLLTFSLNTDPGWLRQGQWAFGPPTGQGGGPNHGYPDPTTGPTGSNVFGVNLNGNYSTTPGGPFYLTAGPFNFVGDGGMVLHFERWLNSDVQPYASDTVDVSNDGTNWSNIFSNGASGITDAAWTNCQYDISAVADSQPTVYVRWGYQIAAGAFAYSGWNIDDITFLGLTKLQVHLPASTTKGAGLLAGQGSISVIRAPTNSVTIALTSSDTSKVTVPATVMLPAGQTNVNFNLTIGDNHLLDGTEVVAVTASSIAYSSGTNSIMVYDNETAVLSVALPATANEGNPPVQGTISSSAAPAADIPVSLSSSDTNAVLVPATVVLPAGQTSVSFSAAIVNNNAIYTQRAATITAHVYNWTDGSATIDIFGNQNTNLTLMLPAQARQSNGVMTNAGRIWLSGILATNLPVSLSCNNTQNVVLPAYVVIPAGQTSAVFNVTMLEGGQPYGTFPALVNASASGFNSGQAMITLIDDQTPPPPFNPTPPNLSSNNSVSVQLSWNAGVGEGIEQLANGDFESGDLRDWVASAGTDGNLIINDGTFQPPSQDGPTAPYTGNYSALAYQQSVPAFSELYQTVTLPNTGVLILSWVDRIRNFAGVFASNQQFSVELHDTNDVTLAVLYSTQPGDPLLGDWTLRSVDLCAYAGQTVRLVFVINASLNFLDVHLDNVSIRAASLPPATYDVYFGTNSVPGPAQFLGSTTNLIWPLPRLTTLTPYYWQIVARRANSTPGPIWEFSSMANLTVSNVTVFTGNSQNTNAVFNFRLDAASSQPVTVDFATADGTAVASQDYISTNGTLTFNAGETNKTISIPIIVDPSGPPGENFFVTLINPVNLVLGGSQATATIYNDDGVPPSLAPIPNWTVTELTLLTFTNTVSDPDLTNDTLVFSLDPGAPPGASIDPNSGVFSWTPSEGQGPATYTITVRVTDSDVPILTDAKTFRVTVNDVNLPPTLGPLPDRAVHAGGTLSFYVTATDPDLPPQVLTFSLDPGAPPGASIVPTNGLFTWLSGQAPIGSTNSFTVRVTDNGSPPLSDASTFTVEVVAPPKISSLYFSGGRVVINWSAIPGQDYRVQCKTNLNAAWYDVPGDVTATGWIGTKLDPYVPGPQRFYRVLVLP